MSQLSEKQVGATCYVRPGDGFTAVIKARYADFQVSEINLSGEVAKLTDFKLPAKSEELKIDDDNDLTSNYDLELLPIEKWIEIKEVASLVCDSLQKVEVDATTMSKETRTSIHNSVKKIFGRKIVGSTITNDDKKLLVFTNNVKGARVDLRPKWNWPESYVHFVVYKENCDTMEAASLIAEKLRIRSIKPAFFGYSGTKDRRAKTSQWFSIKKVEPGKIVNGCRKIRNVKVGNFSFKSYHLKLGQLKGNRFRIALRNIVDDESLIVSSVESLRDHGFINYYGLQRFGSRGDVPTYAIGRCLLQTLYKEAVGLILKPHGPLFSALETYEKTGSATKALSEIKFYKNSIEMKLLQALKKEESDDHHRNYYNALEKIPRNVRLLYIHSYQSWIWNRCVSERLNKFGFKCSVGDLVLNSADCENIEEEIIEAEIDAELDDKTEENVPEDKAEIDVKILTESDIESQKYTIFDVVMPLPGFTITYPPNMKDYYEELLKADGLSLELKNKTKCYSLSGTYRHMLTKPENVSWKFIKYTDPFCDLIASDMDELHKRQPIEDVSDGKFKALVLQFDLPSSTYATMALRELLKMDTSSEMQAKNNDYHKDADGSEKRKCMDDASNNKRCKSEI